MRARTSCVFQRCQNGDRTLNLLLLAVTPKKGLQKLKIIYTVSIAEKVISPDPEARSVDGGCATQ